MPGGGSTAGEIGIPGFMEDMHKDFIGARPAFTVDKNMTELLNEDLADSGNPYYNEIAFNPTTIINSINTQVDKPITAADSFDYAAYVDSITTSGKVKADEFFSLTNMLSDISTTLSQASTQALSQYASQQDVSEANVSTMIDSFISKAATNIDALMSSAGASVQTAVSNALTQAMTDLNSVLDTEAFRDTVDSFVDATNPEFYRLLNEFTGQMVESGAIDSSSYQMAMAMFLSHRHKDIVTTVKETFSSNFVPNYLNTFSTLMKDYLVSTTGTAALQGSLYNTNIGQRMSLLVSQISGYLQSLVSEFKSRTMYNTAVMELNKQLLSVEVDYLLKSTSMFYDSKKLALVAETNQKDRDIELDVSHAKWSWDIYQWYANAFASAMGGVGMSPVGMTKSDKLLEGIGWGSSFGLAGAAIHRLISEDD